MSKKRQYEWMWWENSDQGPERLFPIWPSAWIMRVSSCPKASINRTPQKSESLWEANSFVQVNWFVVDPLFNCLCNFSVQCQNTPSQKEEKWPSRLQNVNLSNCSLSYCPFWKEMMTNVDKRSLHLTDICKQLLLKLRRWKKIWVCVRCYIWIKTT